MPMKPSRIACAPMRRTLLHFITILLLATVARAGEWTLYKVGGRDHVSLENVGEFYNLGPLRRSNNDFTLTAGWA